MFMPQRSVAKIASKETGLKKLLLNLFRFGRLVAEPASLLR
jgi:hypothetical protein